MRTPAPKYDLNLPLKLAIVSSRRPQGEIAVAARIGEVRLSKIVTGRIEPTENEQKRLAKVLRRQRAELFPTAEAVAS